MKLLKQIVWIFLFGALWGRMAQGQAFTTDYSYSAGLPSFATTIPVQNGFIDLSNGNLHMEFGVAAHPQRGALNLNERLVYDSKFWSIGHYSNYYWWPDNVNLSPNLAAGWRFVTGAETGTLNSNYQDDEEDCTDQYGRTGSQDTTYYTYSWADPQGTVHGFSGTYIAFTSECDREAASPQSMEGYAVDGSGYRVLMSGQSDSAPTTVQIFDSAGTQVYPEPMDRYGNYWSLDSNGNLIDDRGLTPVIRTDSNSTGSPNTTDTIDFAVLDANGSRQHYIVTTEYVKINTLFQEEPVQEWLGELLAVKSIQLPDGSTYSFTYESDSTLANFGEMTSMTLPTGGTIHYGWGKFLDSFQNENRWLTSYTVGTDPASTFTPSVLTQCSSSGTGCQEQVNYHRPSGDETVYTLTMNNGAWNGQTDVYSGSATSGTKLTSTANGYDFTQSCSLPSCYGAQFITLQNTTTTLLDTAQQTTTQYAYNAPWLGRPSSMKQYDFYTGSLPSVPALETDYSYDDTDLIEQTVKDGSGNRVADTLYNYTASATATTGVVGHGANSGIAALPYLSSIQSWTGGSNFLTTTLSMEDTGAVLSSTDYNGTVQYAYDGTHTFVSATTLPTPSSGVALGSSQTPSPYTGEIINSTGMNSSDQTAIAYDTLGRQSQVTGPDGGVTTYEYISANDHGITKTMNNSGTVSENRTLLDAYGRDQRSATSNGQSGNPWYQQDTCYDANGRIQFVSLPYAGQGWGTSITCSGTQYTYDALNRPTSVQNADGTSSATYTGRAVKTTDVNGVQKIVQSDALGRITDVCEVTANSSADGYQNCGLDIAGSGLLTHYTYNLPNHTKTVTQGVSQTRIFQTDAIGRKVTTVEPERGTTNYTYSYNSFGLSVARTRPQANQNNASILTTTTTQYDSLGRILQVTYLDNGATSTATPTKTFQYDQPAYGWAEAPLQNNLKGRLSLEVRVANVGTTGVVHTYSPGGNIVATYSCDPSTCGTGPDQTVTYSYDLAGNLTGESDAAGATYTYGRSPAGEITGVTSTFSDANDPANIISPNSVTNTPVGPLNYQLGNGLYTVNAYDTLGRHQGVWFCQGTSSWGCQNGGTQYGNYVTYSGPRVTYVDDTVMGQQRNLGYDDFNRLSSSTSNNGQAFQWAYDRWGNRSSQNVTAGSGLSPQYSYPSANQDRVDFSYDAAGNVVNDSTHTYTFDADGNVTDVDGGTTAHYVYDSLNRRVRMQNAGGVFESTFDQTGKRIADFVASSTYPLLQAFVYMDGQPLAFRAQGAMHFMAQDWMGSERATLNAQGALEGTMGELPFGDQRFSNGFTWNAGFAGLDFDSESGTSHAQFRQLSTAAGRWLSPDPYDGSYDFSNPQSLNRYSYVNNMPLSMTDPSGRDPLPCGLSGDPDAGIGGPAGGGVVGVAECVGDFILDIFGVGKPTFHGSLEPRPGSNGPIWNEHLGLPGGTSMTGGQLSDLFGLGQQGCEFGACGSSFGAGGGLGGPPSCGADNKDVCGPNPGYYIGLFWDAAKQTAGDFRNSLKLGSRPCIAQGDAARSQVPQIGVFDKNSVATGAITAGIGSKAPGTGGAFGAGAGFAIGLTVAPLWQGLKGDWAYTQALAHCTFNHI